MTDQGGAERGAEPGTGLAAQVAEVTAFWSELGLSGLIDIHTHFMPANVMKKVWAYFDNVGSEGGLKWPIAYRLPEEDRIELLRAFGVRRFSALNYPHKPGMAAWLNGWSAEFAARTPDALHSATFFAEPAAAGYVARALSDGARLFKAHVQVGGYDPRSDLLDPVWGLLADAGVPVVVHCGSGPFPGRHTGPGPMSEVIARHPRLTAIIAHFGTPEYAEFLDLAETYPGVFLDTTMASCPGWPGSAARSCWAATSPTSPIPTRISSGHWHGSASARRGCGRSATTTRPRCSGCELSPGRWVMPAASQDLPEPGKKIMFRNGGPGGITRADESLLPENPRHDVGRDLREP